MSITAVPTSQKHESIVPAYIPVYNHILVTPNQSRNETQLSLNANSDSITFDISGDNCVNLSKSYLDFVLDYTTGQWRTNDLEPFVLPAGVVAGDIVAIRNSMNFGTLKVYNKTGTLICDLDQSYNEYRDLAHQLTYKYPDDLKTYDYYDKLFEGLHINNDEEKGLIISNELLADADETDEGNGGVRRFWEEQLSNGTYLLHGQLHCRFHFADIYNTILALKNDIFFGEVMYIQISFAPIMSWLVNINRNDDEKKKKTTWTSNFTMKVINPRLYVCYNKDPTCNANTINYCTHHPIDFTDFNIVQIIKDPIPGSMRFNYNFSINSSIGSYVKFILYRAYFNDTWDRTVVSFDHNMDRIRWQINDFIYTPDYLYPHIYETWEYMKYIIQDTVYDVCNPDSFPVDFFEVLNFSTDRLTELKLRAGKDLSSDLKITLDCDNWLFDRNHQEATIHHKFYIITGKQLIIGAKGVERVV